MKYELENCSAELTIEKEPMVTFIFHGSDRKDKFYASQILSLANKVKSFTPPPCWDDEINQTVSAYEIHLLAGYINKELTLSVGRYEMVWFPNDPLLPF